MNPKFEGMQIETITSVEAVQILRSLGLQTSEPTLALGLEQGVYPFGVCIHGKARKVEIYKVLFDQWISERLSPRTDLEDAAS